MRGSCLFFVLLAGCGDGTPVVGLDLGAAALPVHCGDHALDGDETDVDCGGPACAPCPDRKMCVGASDCQGKTCTNNVCKSPVMCTAPMANCDGNAASGCNVDTSRDAANCGGCGMACPMATPTCSGGKCVAAGCPNGLQFAAVVDYTGDTGSVQVVVADLNGDGAPDVLAAQDQESTVEYYENAKKGNGSLKAARSVGVGSNARSLAVGDADGDGKPDVVASAYGDGDVMVLYNQGNALGNGKRFGMLSGPTQVAFADVDGDGKLDIAVGNAQTPAASVLLNQGGGLFGGVQTLTVPTIVQGVAAGALDGDGKPDLVATGRDVFVLLNQGGGHFGAPSDYPAGSQPIRPTLADVNGDGRLDVIVANVGNGTTASVLLNQGHGLLGAHTDYDVKGSPAGTAAGDLDGDGRVDLAFALQSGGSNVAVLRNTGGGMLAAPLLVPVTSSTTGVAMGDLDGDGKLDLVVSYGVGVGVLLNRCK